MSPLKSKIFFSFITISTLSCLLGSQSVQAQRPEQSSSNTLLLSRNCDSQYAEVFEQAPVVSIGRETFNPDFYIANYYQEPGYLTCNVMSQNAGAVHPSHLKLQFGLLDSSTNSVRTSVTAYVDGDEWGSVMLQPRQRSQVWVIEVQDASSISLEVACIEQCGSSGQRVHFVNAEFEFVGGSD